ncbi:hypothetical protein [Enterobacter hormaechei]|uniref:hypothetical protein n=1 Tax=Enterobacter hormaechei TaxID=158836 RepID=UPI000AF58FD3
MTLATTAGDNVINASEQAAGFTLSGTSKNLARERRLPSRSTVKPIPQKWGQTAHGA